MTAYGLKHRGLFVWNGREYPLSLKRVSVPPAKPLDAKSTFGGIIDISDGRSIVLAMSVNGGFSKDAADQRPEGKANPYNAKHVSRLGSKWQFKVISDSGEAIVPNMKHGTTNGQFVSESGKWPLTGAKAGLPYNAIVSANLRVVAAKDAAKTLDEMTYTTRTGPSLVTDSPASGQSATPASVVVAFQHPELEDVESTVDSLEIIRKLTESEIPNG